jgi:hypothetical protein
MRVAFYTKLGYHGFLPAELDLAYIPPGFYSPFSFVTPVDAFYAFGSNMVGAGKFIGRGEGSPYTQNMAGFNLTINPKLPGYGHLRLKYGQHFNVNDEGSDLLFFQYRLNGSDMFTFFHSSYNRWGNGLIDNSVKTGGRKYAARLGDESFWSMSGFNNNYGSSGMRAVAGPGAGGLRSDFLAMFEGFVPYRDSMEAYNNFKSKQPFSESSNYLIWGFDAGQDMYEVSTINSRAVYEYKDVVTVRRYVSISGENIYPNDPRWDDELGITYGGTLYTWDQIEAAGAIREEEVVTKEAIGINPNSYVPQSKKYTFNLELDAAYDIGKFIGYKKDLFVGGYAGINGVTRSNMSILSINEKGANTLLWSFYLRLEPAIALHKNFYLLGLVGYENWKSDKSWMMVNRTEIGGVRYITGYLDPTTTSSNTALDIRPDNFVEVPIDYQDWAFGLGFDWDMLERVGLHGRVKWISHTDKGFNDKLDEWYEAGKGKRSNGDDIFTVTPEMRNDWSTWVVSLEIKMWF